MKKVSRRVHVPYLAMMMMGVVVIIMVMMKVMMMLNIQKIIAIN